MKCRGPVNRLIMMRKRGLGGPLMQNIGGGVCAKSVGAYLDVNGGGGTELPVFYAATYDPDTFELLPQRIGDGVPTFTHASPIYAADHEGVYREFAADKPVWKDGRVVTNIARYPADFNLWSNKVNITIDSGIADPFGGNDAQRITGSSTGDVANYVRYLNVFPLDEIDYDSMRTSWWIKRNTGSGKVHLYRGGGGGSSWIEVTSAVTQIGVWVRVSPDAESIGATTLGSQGFLFDEPDEFDLYMPQYEGVNGNAPPSEVIPNYNVIDSSIVTSVFANSNGNTVAGDVVTEADGELLDPQPYLAARGFAEEGALTPVTYTPTYAAANHDDTESTYFLEIDWDGADTDVLTIDGNLLSIVAGNLTLTDGVNTAELPILAGQHSIGVHYGGGIMDLNLDGLWLRGTTYDGSFGTGDILQGENAREIKRFPKITNIDNLLRNWVKYNGEQVVYNGQPVYHPLTPA